jgi:23S rRNA (pseudouridine1915-N3)-methyltransferase
MRIDITAIGRLKAGPERILFDRYLDRATATGRKLGLSGFACTELSESRASSATARKSEEARALMAALPDKACIVCLDEHGQSQTSLEFADMIARWRDDGRQNLGFIIGGADGLAPDFVKNADKVLAFSPLTWPHQLVRIMLAEQLYRATTILDGHPYHRGA